MDAIARNIEGGYTFLLISQILIVTALVAGMLVLVFRRIREAFANGITDIGVPATENSRGGANAEAVNKLELQIKMLTQENEKLKASGGGASATMINGLTPTEAEAKIKFLESKLIEYEILQEEISTLSSLKKENMELKKALVEAKAAADVPKAS